MEIERAGDREGEEVVESGVRVCLLTESLKSMAVLMNISLGKLMPSSTGTSLVPCKFA